MLLLLLCLCVHSSIRKESVDQGYVCSLHLQGDLDSASSSFTAAQQALGGSSSSSSGADSKAVTFEADAGSCLSIRLQQEVAADVALGAAQVSTAIVCRVVNNLHVVSRMLFAADFWADCLRRCCLYTSAPGLGNPPDVSWYVHRSRGHDFLHAPTAASSAPSVNKSTEQSTPSCAMHPVIWFLLVFCCSFALPQVRMARKQWEASEDPLSAALAAAEAAGGEAGPGLAPVLLLLGYGYARSARVMFAEGMLREAAKVLGGSEPSR
jgi:hypothetical protein